ncbi:hypothetical protein [Pelotomaculum schinkii]|uniref:hypothetical protein n=1 Tax=Pelotomaculum schinkii TaxID=78350 RepID=UPI00167CEB38|nr:hypothetical protein [Pelotomaculum schinkii]
MQEAITCRCWFYRADETGACWAKCPKRVASCVVCGFGGRQFKPAGKLKKYRNKVK